MNADFGRDKSSPSARAENSYQPLANDAVLGGETPPPVNSAVLGGLAGVKQRLAKGTVEQKIDALLDAFQYGQAGLDAVIQALDDRSNQVSSAAYLLLEDSQELRVKQALQNYNRFARFECLHTINGNGIRKPSCLAISSVGKTLVSDCYDMGTSYWYNEFKVWDLRTGELINSLYSRHEHLAVSSDGKTAVCHFQNIINVWDVQTGRQIRWFCAGDDIASFAISADGQTVLCGSFGNVGKPTIVEMRDVETGELVRSLNLNSQRSIVRNLIISPNGQILFTRTEGNYDYDRVWDLTTGELIGTFAKHQIWIDGFAINSNGQTLASGIRDGSIKVWNLHTDEIICSVLGASPSVMSHDGKILVCGSDDNTIKVWDVQIGKELRTLQGHSFKIEHLALSADKQFIVSYSEDRTIKVWGMP